MKKKLKLYIIAGEPSGDNLGAKLIKALKNNNNYDISFSGIGGENMQKEGMHSLFPMSELSIMGFLEVIPHIPNVLNRINETVEEIYRTQPDIVITIDSPGFCFRVAKKLKNRNFKLVHYVAPTVWAYKPGRAKKIAKLYDHLLAILPFEPPYFDAVGLDNSFIGHPIVEDFKSQDLQKLRRDFRKKHNISESAKVLCMLGGSRISEIKRLMPIYIETCKILSKRLDNLHIVVPTLPHIKDSISKYMENSGISYVIVENKDDKDSAYAACDVALAKSGTATLEISLFKLPMIIAYKVSFVSYLIIKSMIKIKYANLINIILNKEVIPEFIQGKCNADNLSRGLLKLFNDQKMQKKQIDTCQQVFKDLGLEDNYLPSQKAAKVILKLSAGK
ncbi:lipid-A-disaccharide synthase [Rickettsiales bacterium]|nr:lipid-A-disaccharide synthase [Rickettsiales bacterium]